MVELLANKDGKNPVQVKRDGETNGKGKKTTHKIFSGMRLSVGKVTVMFLLVVALCHLSEAQTILHGNGDE